MVPIVTMAAETLADGPGQRPVDGEVPRLPAGRSALFAGWDAHRASGASPWWRTTQVVNSRYDETLRLPFW